VSTSRSAQYHHGDLREALIAAALAILEEGGDPNALTLREAARRAGVSAMAPYRHFADKQALLAAVAEIGFARLGAALTEADSHPDRSEALLGQGVAYVAFATQHPALFRLMFGGAIGERPATLEGADRAAYDVMARRVGDLVPAEIADDFALRCWATAHGLASLAVEGQLARFPVPLPDLTRRILSVAGGPGKNHNSAAIPDPVQ
jgi:AcrR family transcriptional regulator